MTRVCLFAVETSKVLSALWVAAGIGGIALLSLSLRSGGISDTVKIESAAIITLVTFLAAPIVSTLILNEGRYVFLDSAAGNVVAQTGSRSVQLGTHSAAGQRTNCGLSAGNCG